MPDQEEQRKGLALTKDAILFGTRLGAALAGGQPLFIVEILADLADGHTERLKHIEQKLDQTQQKIDKLQQKIDKLYAHVFTLLYTQYGNGYDYLRMAYETEGRKERRERLKVALQSFVVARRNVLLPLERVDTLLHIGICHLLLGEKKLAKKRFAEARTELQNLQVTLDSNSNGRFTSIDGTLMEMQSLPTHLRRTPRADESKSIVSQINSGIAEIERLERLKLPPQQRVNVAGTALVTTGAALGGFALYVLRRRWEKDR